MNKIFNVENKADNLVNNAKIKPCHNYLLKLQSPIHAEYTETIYGICHNLCMKEIIESNNTLTDEEILQLARPKIFNFSYTFFDDEDKKKALETGILKHFYFNEIGQEVYSYWHFELQHWMETNMERYYMLFKTIPFQDQENPTFNTNYTEEYTRGTKGDSQTTGKDKTTSLSSSTPQGRVDLESTNYVDSIVQGISEPGTKTNTNGTEDYHFHREGNIGVQTLAEVLNGSRNAIITLENQLYSELEEYGLFMLIY